MAVRRVFANHCRIFRNSKVFTLQKRKLLTPVTVAFPPTINKHKAVCILLLKLYLHGLYRHGVSWCYSIPSLFPVLCNAIGFNWSRVLRIFFGLKIF